MRRQGKKGAGLQPAPASTVGRQLQAVPEGALGAVKTTSHEVVFLVDVPPEVIQREKEKARVLRRSQWWQRRLARGECYYCHCKVPPQELTMDHIVPLARGAIHQGQRGTRLQELQQPKKISPADGMGRLPEETDLSHLIASR